VEIAFCADETVRALNKRHRKLDKVTDVLSFAWDPEEGEEDFAGEIYIANTQAKRQAPRFNNNYFNELRRLVVHGMLHLCGHDHMKAGERARMRALEDRYLAAAAPIAKVSAVHLKKTQKTR
jgi:probable rRNA maturation factor